MKSTPRKRINKTGPRGTYSKRDLRDAEDRAGRHLTDERLQLQADSIVARLRDMDRLRQLHVQLLGTHYIPQSYPIGSAAAGLVLRKGATPAEVLAAVRRLAGKRSLKDVVDGFCGVAS